MKSIGQEPSKLQGSMDDPVDELVGWCPDGGCSFSPISENNDDCSNQTVSLEDDRFSFINNSVSDMPAGGMIEKIPMQQNNDQFQKKAKQQEMDSSYERLIAERQLLK